MSMFNKPLSKILLGVLFKAAVDFVAEANQERKHVVQNESNESNVSDFSKTLHNQTTFNKGEKPLDDDVESRDFGLGVLLGSLVGGLVGAGLALWYAPQTGKKTQALLKREAKWFQKQASKKASNLYNTAEEIVNDATERASGLTEQGREFVEEKTSTLKKAVAR